MPKLTAEQKQGSKDIIEKCQNILDKKGLNFPTGFLSSVDSQALNKMLKQYQQMMKFGQKTAEEYFEQMLSSTINKLQSAKLEKESISLMANIVKRSEKQQKLLTQSQLTTEIKQGLQVINVKRQREIQHDKIILNEWKDARSKWYTNKQLIGDHQQGQDCEEINRQFVAKRRECPPLQQPINKNIQNLKSIYIEYQLRPQIQRQWIRRQDKYYYSISAFQLFKFIHHNKFLTQVTIRGVLVQNSQPFIQELMSSRKTNAKAQKKSEQSWMRDFNPPPNFKLAINTQIIFQIKNKQKTLQSIRRLTYFGGLFSCLSHITAIVRLGKQARANKWPGILPNLWICLHKIKKIQLQIEGETDISPHSISYVRSLLFGGLASFTQISSLSFKHILFQDIELNDYFAIKQSLVTLFQNNTVNHLRICFCKHFPFLPYIDTLKTFEFTSFYFFTYSDYISNLASMNPKLIQASFSSVYQSCQVSEKLFNQLQALILFDKYIINVNSYAPSNIKYLRIEQSRIQNQEILKPMFPKLVYLTYLSISHMDYGHQTLCTIPSPYLEEIHIRYNDQITEIGLKQIDSKWPFLVRIELTRCRKITNKIFNMCKFKGLIELHTEDLLREDEHILKQLRIRGIRVYSY